MKITRDELSAMKLAAAMCDDYGQWKKEISEIQRLEAQLAKEENRTGQQKVKKEAPRLVRKRPSGGIRCSSIGEALNVLNDVLRGHEGAA